jgi:hypothetical protein
LTYKLTPWYLLILSIRILSNLSFNYIQWVLFFYDCVKHLEHLWLLCTCHRKTLSHYFYM